MSNLFIQFNTIQDSIIDEISFVFYDRTLYTRRIMDIITSINKQNKEINKITIDIRNIQKLINSSTSSLSRADAITEDLIYSVSSIITSILS